MIFMSQSAITDPSRCGDWDAWYVEHLRIMASVPGVTSAQRFLTDSPGHPPSLAMYTMTGPEIFDDPYYRSVRGMGEWLELIDRRHYRRNLFAGLAHAPRVAAGERLIVADRDREDPSLADLCLAWLSCAGIDRSTPLRGIAVVDAASARLLSGRDVAIYRPVTECVASAGAR
ncbi:MAG: hypothetical protein IT529_05505 [Burkholderiales bacterium]|nr:hypothetical protein [Burkholderiales bacterium]